MISRLRKKVNTKVLIIAVMVLGIALASSLTFGKPLITRGVQRFTLAVGLAKPVAAAKPILAPPMGMGQSSNPFDGKDVLIVYVTPNGFQPSEVETSAGPKIVLLRDRTSADSLTYVISNPGKSRAVKANSDGASDLTMEFNMVDDQAVLLEENHPQWACHFKIVE